MSDFSPKRYTEINTALSETLFHGLFTSDRKKSSSFDKSTLKSFESIILKVPDDITSIFNEIITSNRELRPHIFESLKRCKKRSTQFLNTLDKFASRKLDYDHEVHKKINDTLKNINKLFLVDKCSSIYIGKENPDLDLKDKNVLYLPLFPIADFCPLFTLFAHPEHYRRTLICSNWFEGPMFFNIYHYFSGAYPIINTNVAHKFRNHLKLSKMKIGSLGAELGQERDEDIKTFNKEVCDNFLNCLLGSKQNSLMVYPEGKDFYPYMDLRFNHHENGDYSKEIRVPKSFARWIVEALEKDPELIIKPVGLFVQDDDGKAGKDVNGSMENFLNNSGSKAKFYLYENSLSTKKLNEIINDFKNKATKKEVTDPKIRNLEREELYNQIDSMLGAKYKDAIAEIMKMMTSPKKYPDLLKEEKRIVKSKIKHNPKFSISGLVKELCRKKSIEDIKAMEAFDFIKGLGIDLDLLFKNYFSGSQGSDQIKTN